MKKLTYIILVISILLVTSCANELKTMNEGKFAFSSINASMADLPTSRAHLENNSKVVWDIGDKVGIYSDTQTIPTMFTCTNAGGNSAVFSSDGEVSGSNFYAYYPYEDTNIVDDVMAYTLPFYTRYKVGTYYQQSPMIAQSNTNEFEFKHTCGFIRFSITGTHRIQTLILEGNNGEVLAGTGTIDLTSKAPTLSIPADASDASQSISMGVFDLGLTSTATDFYFIVPVGEFTKGLTLTIDYIGEDGFTYRMKKRTSKHITISRSVMKSFSVFDTDELMEQEEERIYTALMSFYNATGGDNWTNNTNWGSDKPFSEWYGVYMYDNCVNGLFLDNNNLIGAITNEFNELSDIVNLSIRDNQLTSLNVSGCKELDFLDCSLNQISSLDITNCINLKELSCQSNQLVNLDVSSCPELISIHCSVNKISSLDVTKCTKLKKLYCQDNQMASLDVSGSMELEFIMCYTNQISSLDIDYCPKLNTVYCSENQITKLTPKGCTELAILSISENQISTLDISNCSKLVVLDVSENKLKNLDVNDCILLQDLDCGNNQLNKVDISNLLNLTYIRCTDNKLTELDVRNNTQLAKLLCNFNELKAIDVSNNVELETLWCDHNKLLTLDITNLTKLRSLSCGNNEGIEGNYLTELDLSNNIALEYVSCEGMKLTSLDTKNNLLLDNLDCSRNPITSMDLSENTQLTCLICRETSLSKLDVSNNLQLEKLATTKSPNLSTIYISTGQNFKYEKDNHTNFSFVDN